MKPNVGVIGLGAMGMGVARSLLRAGFTVAACDVREEARAAIEAAGGTAYTSPAEVGKSSAIIITLVVNAEQTERVLFGPGGAVETLAPGSAVIASATVPPEFAIALERRLAERGLLLLDAPVSGGAAKAAQGQMTVMASGPAAVFAKVRPVLDAIAAKVYELGDAAGPGSTAKMVNQLLAGVHIAAAAEAMALGIRAGADPVQLFEVISNSAGSSWMFQNRVPHILAGDYTPLSAVNIFVKDLGLVSDAARKLMFPVPLTAAALQMFVAASAAGHGGEDDSAVIKAYAKLTGIALPPAKDA
ncbi:MAG: NAD-binding protein [Betaproteobacteria bacterium]|nr:NAD-binding protein [Betaproteobacteria bacterium]